MGQTGRFFGDLEGIFGKGTVTSGYRSQEEQDRLVAQGATKATRSSHTYRDGYDLKINVAETPEQLKARLEQAGHKVAYIRRESGSGKNQGTGPHWHVELGDPGKGGTRMAGGNGSGKIGVLDAAAAASRTPSVGPEARASRGVSVGPTDKVFGSDQEIQGNFSAIDQNLAETKGKIDVLSVAQAAAHADQMTAMSQQVQDTRAINDEITQGVQALKRTVMPVFEARKRVSDQLDHLTTMNPLERAVRGVFDLNYDKEFLTGQLDSFDRTLKARADDFNYLDHLNQVALREIDRRYGLATAESGLLVAQGKEDLGLLGQSLANLSGILANNQGEIQSQVQIAQAKQAARGDLIDRLDINTITDLANQARQAGGVINYHGMDFSYHELYERMQKNEQQQVALEGMRLGIASQRMDFAEKQAINVIQTMTKGQLEAAIQNGGQFQGMQLPQDALTSAYASMTQREQLQAEQYMQALPAKAVGDYVLQNSNRDVAIFNRASGLYGPQDFRQSQAIFQDNTRLYGELTQAIHTKQPPQVINAIRAQIEANSTKLDQGVEGVILRNAGGDKRAAGYISSFVRGTPINAGTATEAITYFAIKGGMPEGMMASPEARDIFQRAQVVVQQNRLDENGKPRSEPALQQIVAQKLGETTFKTVGTTRFNRMWADLPTLAGKAGSPLGKITKDQWDDIEQKSTADAIMAMAGRLGVSRDALTRMVQTGKPVSQAPADVEAFKKFQAGSADFNAIKQRATIDLLDDLPLVQPGVNNSEVLTQFLRSPATQNMAGVYTKTTESNGMGDFFVGPLANGALERNIQVTAERLGQAAASSTADKRASARRLDSMWANSPPARANFILQSIPGVGKDGASVLMPFLIEQVNSNVGMQIGAGIAAGVPGGFREGTIQRQEAIMKAALQNHKFEDPRMEAYRKAAVRGWDDSSTQATGFVETLLDALKNTAQMGM